ncbi:hypothetical protein Tco_0783513, partial [Tanacetum coccineum]
VMAISTISISSDSFEESVGTPSGRVLWFGRIPTTVPVTTPTIDPPVIHDDTLLIPTKTPTISPITSTIPPTALTTHYTSPFIYTDSSNKDTPDTPPSPTHEIPPVEVAPPSQIPPASPGVCRRRVPIVSPGQPIPHVDYSSSDYFTSDDSSRDSPMSSSSETSSDSSSDALSDSSSVPSIPHSPAATTERPSHSSSAGPSRKRSRSPTTSIPVSSPIPRALSSVRADLLPPRKRIRSSDSVMDLEVSSDESSESSVPRETGLRVDVDVGGSDEPYSEPDIDPDVQVEIDECIAYADALRAKGIDVRVVVETVAREEVETSTRGMVEVRDDRVTHPVVSDDIPEPAREGAIEVTYETLGDLVQRFHDHTVEIPVHRVQVIESIQRDQGHKIVATGQQGAVMSERISELERDNTRLRGMLDVASQRVTRFQRRELRVQREMRQIRRLRFYDRVRIEGGDEQEDENGDDYEGRNGGGNGNGNGNGNGGVNGNGNDNGNRGVNGNRNGGGNGNGNGGGNSYGNHNVNFGGFMLVARECTFQGFLKCQPLNFNWTEGVVVSEPRGSRSRIYKVLGLKGLYSDPIITSINIFDAAVCLSFRRELVWIGRHGILWMIQKKGNVIAAEPTRLQHAIRIANNLMDQKLKGYARSSELGSELTFLAGSELKTSELDTSELKTSEYKFLKIYIQASYEQELCQFNFLLASCQLSSSELRIASYSELSTLFQRVTTSELQMGTFRETLTEGSEGALHLGPERPRVYSDLSPEDKERTYGTM